MTITWSTNTLTSSEKVKRSLIQAQQDHSALVDAIITPLGLARGTFVPPVKLPTALMENLVAIQGFKPKDEADAMGLTRTWFMATQGLGKSQMAHTILMNRLNEVTHYDDGTTRVVVDGMECLMTTDFHDKLVQHPDVIACAEKMRAL